MDGGPDLVLTGTRIRVGLPVQSVQRLKTRPQFQAALAGGTVCRTTHFALHRVALDAPGLLVSEQASTPCAALFNGADKTVATNGSGAIRLTSKSLFPVDDAWIGAMAPKRWAKRAVTRNAIKRQIYQLSTDLALQLPHAAHVVRLRASFDRKQFVSASSDALKTAVRSELVVLFSKALHGTAPATTSPRPQK